MKRFILVLPAILLTGCMNGDMRGVMSDGTPVTMSYEQGMSLIHIRQTSEVRASLVGL